MNHSRRTFLKKSVAAAIGAALLPYCKKTKGVVFLLVSGWQDVNIGDVAHTPGMIAFIREYFKDPEIIWWPKGAGPEGIRFMKSNFPDVTILPSWQFSENQENEEVLQSISRADVCVHSSGPGIVGLEQLKIWKKHSSKPYGAIGVTIGNVWDELEDILRASSFLFTRESLSLKILREKGIEVPGMGFAPDVTFMFDLKNDLRSFIFRQTYSLEKKKYICVVPRLRYTPYHLIHPYINWPEEKIAEVNRINEAYREKDHAVMRKVMEKWIRSTGHQVAVCPEMSYQTEIMDELLIDPLPSDIQASVRKHTYWMPDEAASLYRDAFAVISFECHSPILALINKTPAFYLRQPEDTIKGQMYYDLGFGDWVFPADQMDAEHVSEVLLKLWEQKNRRGEVEFELEERLGKEYLSCVQSLQNILPR